MKEPTADQAAQNVRFYDAEAHIYDASRYSGRAGQRVDAFHKGVLHRDLFADLPIDADVLELGCGTCRLLAHFRRSHQGVIGLDASPGMLAVGMRRLRGNTGLVRGDAYRLPFADASFDAVYSILVINLLPDYGSAITEIARVLKPGGRVLFNVPNLESVYAMGGLYVNLRGRTTGRNRAGHRYSHWFRQREIAHSLGRAGLTIVRTSGQPPLLSLWPSKRPLGDGLLASLISKSRYFLAAKTPLAPSVV